MSKKQWILLLCLFAIYLLMGASFFYIIESEEEGKKLHKEKEERKHIEDLLKKYYNGNDKEFLKRLSDYCEKPLDLNMSTVEVEGKWDFYHSLFFVITVVSTIGYGNLAPTTMLSRIIMIFYGLIGIPINGIVMVNLGSYFGSKFEKLYHRWKTSKMQYDTAALGLISQIFLYLIPGFVFFIFMPALIIMMCEGWEYDLAVYYCFVTLTTIGFGDYVAGFDNVYHIGHPWYSIYKAFLIIWIIGGLGYVLMVINFITRGMSGKKMRKLEQIITNNIKKTPNRIRHELRALLHEFILVKVKPVYKGQFDYKPNRLDRSQSCPDLTLYASSDEISMVRQRAFSVGFKEIYAVQSDTELDKIDKELTFRPSDAFMQQNNLLLKVVDALSYKSDQSDFEGGINLFSDQEILASERYGSSNSVNRNVRQARRRAVSDVRPPMPYIIESEKLSGNTWYGDDAKSKLKQFRDRTLSIPFVQRVRKNSNIFHIIRDAFTSNDSKNIDIEKQNHAEKSNSEEDNAFEAERLSYLRKTTRGRHTIYNVPEESFIRPKSIFDDEKQSYLQKTSRGRSSMFTGPQENYIRQTRMGRHSVLSNYQDTVLEQTSIADLLRALTAATVPEVNLSSDSPKRKLGTASLTPPESTTPSRTRRMPIRPLYQTRRSSLIPTQTTNEIITRRFSLRPVEENLLTPPPPPPYTPVNTEVRRSIRTRNRRFSIRPVAFSSANPGPVQRQVIKKERDDSLGDTQ